LNELLSAIHNRGEKIFMRGCILVLFALSLSSGCGRDSGSIGVAPSDPRIVGSWASVGGDYPLTNYYGADGMLVQHVGTQSSTPYPFRIEGEYLIVSVKQPDGTISQQKDRFSLKDDTLAFIDPDGSKRIFQRNRR
jgi:hypothetical protein